MQVEAIKSGVQPGLTMVVGPPGTGKTDTAVQIMHVLYHNCPGQRTLLITHSNQVCHHCRPQACMVHHRPMTGAQFSICQHCLRLACPEPSLKL